MKSDFLSDLSFEGAKFQEEVTEEGFRYFYIIQKLNQTRWELFDRGIIRTWNPEQTVEDIFGKYRNDKSYRFCLYSSSLDDFGDKHVEHILESNQRLLEKIEKGIEIAGKHGFQFAAVGKDFVSETTGLRY